ncbi:DUF6290 family protein [Dialister sp.]|uniref:DUF6290 family protein n=1 Tax=Dialister sp. TaxID=1955814 RepID=UPI002E8076F7|nr:DUF6290 family protein [Dialister sp.]MEE3452779.1 DUF6290 family protein [Dialister sp.]
MKSISFEVSDEENKMIEDYAASHHLKLSSFIRNAVLDQIEDSMEINKNRVLCAQKQSAEERKWDAQDVWKELDV